MSGWRGARTEQFFQLRRWHRTLFWSLCCRTEHAARPALLLDLERGLEAKPGAAASRAKQNNAPRARPANVIPRPADHALCPLQRKADIGIQQRENRLLGCLSRSYLSPWVRHELAFYSCLRTSFQWGCWRGTCLQISVAWHGPKKYLCSALSHCWILAKKVFLSHRVWHWHFWQWFVGRLWVWRITNELASLLNVWVSPCSKDISLLVWIDRAPRSQCRCPNTLSPDTAWTAILVNVWWCFFRQGLHLFAKENGLEFQGRSHNISVGFCRL